MRVFIAFLVLLCSISTSFAAPSKAEVEQLFQNWLQNSLWPKAQKQGISHATFNKALQNVTINWALPDLVMPGSKPQTPQKQHQAEFSPPENYFKNIGTVISQGKTRLQQNRSTLNAVEQKYGVPADIIVAIWGRESAFGTVKIPYNSFDVLATKAFMASRKDMFEAELLAALTIVQKNYTDVASMKSSWAGALGQPQFMPTSYLKYAVDFDGDGHRNIWTSTPDTLASIANYLVMNGWKRGLTWGFEVSLPQTLSCALEGPDQGKTFGEWQNLGVQRTDGKKIDPKLLNQQGFLLLPAGRYGPIFLVSDNFYVLKAYNMSDLYALFIGHAGDQMRGLSPLKASWQKTERLLRSDVAMMQNRLVKQGYDVGKPDGLAGFKTRRSIGLWQSKNGMTPSCFPNKAIVQGIK